MFFLIPGGKSWKQRRNDWKTEHYRKEKTKILQVFQCCLEDFISNLLTNVFDISFIEFAFLYKIHLNADIWMLTRLSEHANIVGYFQSYIALPSPFLLLFEFYKKYGWVIYRRNRIKTERLEFEKRNRIKTERLGFKNWKARVSETQQGLLIHTRWCNWKEM